MRIVRLLQFIYILLKKTHINTSKQINMYDYVQPEARQNWTLIDGKFAYSHIFVYFVTFSIFYVIFSVWLGQKNNSSCSFYSNFTRLDLSGQERNIQSRILDRKINQLFYAVCYAEQIMRKFYCLPALFPKWRRASFVILFCKYVEKQPEGYALNNELRNLLKF